MKRRVRGAGQLISFVSKEKVLKRGDGIVREEGRRQRSEKEMIEEEERE